MKRTSRSRREFMRLLAAGSAAAMATPVSAFAAQNAAKSAAAPSPRQRRARTGEAAGRPALPEEIEKQKKYTAESLGRIRAYALPPGSPPAFTFRPLAARRAKRSPR